MATIPISREISQSQIAISPSPTSHDLQVLWRAIANDPSARGAYSDLFPRSAHEARRALDRDRMKLWTAYSSGVLLGAWWAHDGGHDGRGLYTWIGTYFLEHARGVLACRTFPLLRSLLAAHGLHRLFAAVRCGNKEGMHFAAHLGFQRVGVCADFTMFDGQFDNVVLYTLDHTDTSHVWVAAARRWLSVRVLLREGASNVPDM